jgi:hypothetical protein
LEDSFEARAAISSDPQVTPTDASAEQIALKRAVLKLALLAQSKGLSIDDLIFLVDAGASLSDLIRSFTEESD